MLNVQKTNNAFMEQILVASYCQAQAVLLVEKALVLDKSRQSAHWKSTRSPNKWQFSAHTGLLQCGDRRQTMLQLVCVKTSSQRNTRWCVAVLSCRQLLEGCCCGIRAAQAHSNACRKLSAFCVLMCSIAALFSCSANYHVFLLKRIVFFFSLWNINFLIKIDFK